jgi:hypothetical protein
MPTKTGQWVYMDDGTVAQQVYNETDQTTIKPVDIQSRLASTIQTHTGATVAAGGSSQGNFSSSWIDCDGFSEIAVTLMNDGTTNSSAQIWWSNDNTNQHGNDDPIVGGTPRYRAGSVTIKARYAKVVIWNNDGAAPHTMSAWALLKA